LLAAAACTLAVAVSSPARANGRFPFSNQFAFSRHDPNLVVLRTTYGILPSHDNGATWGYICEGALGLGSTTTEDPAIGLTDSDALVVGLSAGLNVSNDVGCNWTCQGGPLAGQPIADIAVRPDDPSHVVAITRTYLPRDGGQDNILSQTYETSDNGATWSALGTPLPSDVTVETLDVAGSDPARLYATGTRGIGSLKTAWLFVSKDRGATWAETQLPAEIFDATQEDSLFIGAVDPMNADRLYLRSSGLVTGGLSRLTLATLGADGTPTFAGAHTFEVDAGKGSTGQMLGLALSEDGSKIYIGSEGDGLWVASTTDLAFQKKSSIIVQCLATRGNELWACSAAVSGFIAGVSVDDGATFTAKLPLVGALSGPIACASNPQGAACRATDNSSSCGQEYSDFCAVNGCGSPDAGMPPPPPKKADSSCNVGPTVDAYDGGTMAAGAALAALALGVNRRRRRK
jgi:MYXO-CTERM domain-containing protein